MRIVGDLIEMAALCIVLYCVVMSYLKGNFGYQSIAMLLGITAFANGIIFFVKRNHLEKECGIASWPVCTIPSYRGKGVAKAVIFEALGRAKKLGAKRAYVISDMEFYERLGFRKKYHYSFWFKKEGKNGRI